MTYLALLKEFKLTCYNTIQALEQKILNNPPEFTDQEFDQLFVEPIHTKEDLEPTNYQFRHSGRDLAYEWFMSLPQEEQYKQRKHIIKNESLILREHLKKELTLAKKEYALLVAEITQLEDPKLHARQLSLKPTKEDLTQIKQVPLKDLLPTPFKLTSTITSKTTCPFHQEKTPSFTVYHKNNSYYCFGCQEGGDNIKFVMKLNNMTFMEAINHLRRYV